MKHGLLLALAIGSLAAAPATKPTSAPTRVRDGLINGSVRFLVPAEWELFDRGANGCSVGYQFPDEKGRVIMLVTQQVDVIPANDMGVRKQLAKYVLEKDNEDLAKRKMELIDPPKVEPDGRFMVKVHERFKDGETTVDAIHIYRGIGLNLISVTASVNSDDKEEAKKIHDAAALMLLSVNLGGQDPKIIRPLKKKD